MTEIDRERQTDRQRDRQTDGQTVRKAEKRTVDARTQKRGPYQKNRQPNRRTETGNHEQT